MIMESKQAMHCIIFIFSHHYIHVILLYYPKPRIMFTGNFKIKFGNDQINVSKIGIPILKTTCINPW